MTLRELAELSLALWKLVFTLSLCSELDITPYSDFIRLTLDIGTSYSDFIGLTLTIGVPFFRFLGETLTVRHNSIDLFGKTLASQLSNESGSAFAVKLYVGV